MNHKFRPWAVAVFVVPLAFSLGSCSRLFEIKVSGFGPNIRLEFFDGDFLHSSKLAACIKDLTVYEQIGPTGQDKLVWQINAARRCVTLTGVDVGHVPRGFVEKANLLPLKIGSRYQASAMAEKEYPDSGISSRWFVCRRSPEEANWKNENELRELPPSCVR